MGENNEPPVWDISSLVESEEPEMVKKAIDGTLKLAEKIEKRYKGRIKNLSPAAIHGFYKKLDQVYSAMQPTMDYTYLRQSQDATNTTGRELLEYAMRASSEFDSKLAFHRIEVARALAGRPEIISDPAVKEYRHALEKAKERGKYLLSERDEQLIIDKDLYGIDSWSILHERLRSIRQYDLVIKNEKKQLTALELTSILESSPDRQIRKAATEALYRGISCDRLVFSTALKCVFGDHLSQVRLRKQPSVLTESLLSNDIDQGILDVLIASMKKHTQLIRKYLRLRAKAMGLKKLTGYDISPTTAPPIAESETDFPWSKARQSVIDTYSRFDKEAGEWVEGLFEQRRIDASIRPGKTGYGYCVSFPSLGTSWIMMNYGGALTDMATLAHEAGHALHGHYRSKEHKWTNFDAGKCLAETASTFGEMLLADKLIQDSNDDDTKLAALARILDSLYQKVFYMLNAYLFELSVFTAMESDEAVDAEKLDLLWTAARTEVFGDTVDWLPGMEQWWVFPVHNFMPRYRFYNYPYAFAQLLVLTLYHHYKEEGASFVPKMKRILSAGGSESPKTLLAEVGLDLTDSEFWELGFKQAESYLNEFERIVKRRT